MSTPVLRNRSEHMDKHCNKCAELINGICAKGLALLENTTVKPCFYGVDDYSKYLLRCIFEAYTDKHKLYIKPTIVTDGRYDHYNNRYSGNYDLTTFIIDGDSDMLLVNGEAGIGKSTFIRELYLAVSVYSLKNKSSILPLYFNAEEFGGDTKTPDEWIKENLNTRYKYLNFEPSFYNPGVCVVFFIDAINDIQYTDYNDFSIKLNSWQSYISATLEQCQNVKFVISSRYIENLSNFEIRNYTRLFLKPFDDNQVQSFVNHTVLETTERNRIWEFVKKNDELPFLRIPFYLTKVLTASYEKLCNKTDVINMFIDSLFQSDTRLIRERKVSSDIFGKETTDIRLNGTTFLRAMGELAYDCQSRGTYEFNLQKIENIVHNDTKIFLNIAINNSIFNKGGTKFEHLIFREYFSGCYIAFNLSEVFELENILASESMVHLRQSFKHAYNLNRNKEQFIHILLKSKEFEIAAECAMENQDPQLSAFVANNIVNYIHGRDLQDSLTPNLGLLLGELGDIRFPIKEYNTFEPPTEYISQLKLNVGKYPVTNREYSFFIEENGYHSPEFWLFPADCWFNREQKIQSIFNFWNDIQSKLNSNTDNFFNFCMQNKFDKELIANFVYFKEIGTSDLESIIRSLYSSDRDSVPLMWDNPMYNNPSQPVVGVSWFEALAYCTWLSKKTGKHYRLLTHDEWNFIASASKRNYVYGNRFNPTICNSLESGLKRTTAVGICDANCTKDGIYDLTGNIFEWTSTIYNDSPRGALYTQYICKGGSWIQPADRAISRYIGRGMGWVRNLDLGFRVCEDEHY